MREPTPYDIYHCEIVYKGCADPRFCIIAYINVDTQEAGVFPLSTAWGLFDRNEHLEYKPDEPGFPSEMARGKGKDGFYVEPSIHLIPLKSALRFAAQLDGAAREKLEQWCGPL